MTDTEARVAALSCVGLRKSYGSTVAVDGFDLDVPRGSITALLGPSGCGKTTVLRMIAGLTVPDAGTIRINGSVVTDHTTAVPAERRNVGLVFQDYALFPHLSIAKNVAFGLHNLRRSERARRVADVLELVGLQGMEQRLPSQLSGGQQQRVALARALAPQPDIILLDEPFSNLDAALRATVREDVRAILRAADATAVFVTHDQEEALSLTDRVAVMQAGKLHQLADPHTLYTRPATPFVAEFVGEADMLPGQRAGEFLVDTPIGRLQTTEPVASEQVDVVVRPESLRVRHAPNGIATVVAISYFGHDQLVLLDLGGELHMRARRGPRLDLARGDRVNVTVDGPVVTFSHSTDAPIGTDGATSPVLTAAR